MNIKVKTTDGKDLGEIISFLKTVERCCIEGASRTLKLHIDGDGSADMKFEFENLPGVKDIKPNDYDKNPDFYIGE